VRQYQKIGEFWFPTSTESITQARFVGKTDVNIQYFDYAPNTAAAAESGRAFLREANYVKR
jgi:hypothetical protein